MPLNEVLWMIDEQCRLLEGDVLYNPCSLTEPFSTILTKGLPFLNLKLWVHKQWACACLCKSHTVVTSFIREPVLETSRMITNVEQFREVSGKCRGAPEVKVKVSCSFEGGSLSPRWLRLRRVSSEPPQDLLYPPWRRGPGHGAHRSVSWAFRLGYNGPPPAATTRNSRHTHMKL